MSSPTRPFPGPLAVSTQDAPGFSVTSRDPFSEAPSPQDAPSPAPGNAWHVASVLEVAGTWGLAFGAGLVAGFVWVDLAGARATGSFSFQGGVLGLTLVFVLLLPAGLCGLAGRKLRLQRDHPPLGSARVRRLVPLVLLVFGTLLARLVGVPT